MSSARHIADALVIADPWVDLILQGRKTWENRGTNTKKRGLIGVVRKGSGLVVGVAELVDVKGPLSLDELRAATDRHCVPPERFNGDYRYKTPYAWVLRNAQALRKPVAYSHPSGAVIWVKLSDGVSRAITDALRSYL
jgi:hypothetical protein